MSSYVSTTNGNAFSPVIVHKSYSDFDRIAQRNDHARLITEPTARVKAALPKWRLKRVAEYVNANIDGRISLAGMAAAAGLSRMHFAAQFRIATGMRPHDYVLGRRIERAQDMLLDSRVTIIETALSVGFQTQAHFTTVFRRFVGDTPRHWRCRQFSAAAE